MKFVLFVEGHTERAASPAFFKRWLDPRLPKPVRITPVRFEGWRDYVKDIEKKVALKLSGKTGADVIGAIGLLDLYGPTFYPDKASTAGQRYARAKQYIEGKVSNPRFRQYFAVHETEAWLLADRNILPERVGSALPAKSAQPETVNFDEPPSMLLDRLYWEKVQTAYKKVVDGSNLFQNLSPGLAYKTCPYLRQLLDDMLKLANEAA